MTNEKAANQLKDLYEFCVTSGTEWEDDAEALKVAIAALEQPEQKTAYTESDYAYCLECNHIEMCKWYPHEGCAFRGLPGGFDKAYQEGFEAGRKAEWTVVAKMDVEQYDTKTTCD